jgi:hypothetical protein
MKPLALSLTINTPSSSSPSWSTQPCPCVECTYVSTQQCPCVRSCSFIFMSLTTPTPLFMYPPSLFFQNCCCLLLRVKRFFLMIFLRSEFIVTFPPSACPKHSYRFGLQARFGASCSQVEETGRRDENRSDSIDFSSMCHVGPLPTICRCAYFINGAVHRDAHVNSYALKTQQTSSVMWV